jgi:NAD(P)-dependent dehydrogenase (short-subunit alcohol dehydrogenase family)
MILTGAAAASKGFEGFSVYSGTKAAIRSSTRTWTVDLKRLKISVNVISPGPIDTPISRNVVQSEEQTYQLKTKLVSSVPLGRMGTPDEVAKAVSFLASDDMSRIYRTSLAVTYLIIGKIENTPSKNAIDPITYLWTKC